MKKLFVSLFLLYGSLMCMDTQIDHTSLLQKTPEQFKVAIVANPSLVENYNQDGDTLLASALGKNKYLHAQILLAGEKVTDFWHANTQGYTLFHKLAKKGDIKGLRLVLKCCKNDSRWASMRDDYSENSPLYIAQNKGFVNFAFIFNNFRTYDHPLAELILLGDIEKIKQVLRQSDIQSLLDAHIIEDDFNHPQDKKSYSTPLTFAIMAKDTTIIQSLLDKGAENAGRFISSHIAAMLPFALRQQLVNNRIKLVKKTDFISPKDSAQDSLSKAVMLECTELIDKALQDGADINGFDNAGFTPLDCACLKGSPMIIAKLLELEADPNCLSTKATLKKNKIKRSPLDMLRKMYTSVYNSHNYKIAMSNILPCALLLIRQGANIMVKNDQKESFSQWLLATCVQKETGYTNSKMRSLIQRVLRAQDMSNEDFVLLLNDIAMFQDKAMRKYITSFDLNKLVYLRSISVKDATGNAMPAFQRLYI